MGRHTPNKLLDTRFFGPSLYFAEIGYDHQKFLKVGYTEFHPARRLKDVIRVESGACYNLIRWYSHPHSRMIERELRRVFADYRVNLNSNYVRSGYDEGYDLDVAEYVDDYVNVVYGRSLKQQPNESINKAAA